MKSSLLVVAAVLTTSWGCGGPPKAQSAGERFPANGAPAALAVTSLPSKTIARADWEKSVRETLPPTCDAREGVGTADARSLAGSGKVLDSWTELHAAKGKSSTGAGRKVDSTAEPTRLVDSVGLTCARGASTLQVNGVRYPFDYAWVVTGDGKGRTLNGDQGAGRFTMIEALSLADQRVVFTKVFVPSDANDDTDDTVIVTSLAGYLPANAGVPVVRLMGEREDQRMETFIPALGAAGPGVEGISLQVPEQDPLGRARYLRVGRFSVSNVL